MSVEVVSSRSLNDSPDPKCRACGDPPYIAFNWQHAREGRDSKLHALSQQLQRVKALKFGELYACRACGCEWWLDGDGYMMTRVPGDRTGLFKEWNAAPLPIPAGHIRVLEAIGGTAPSHGWGRDPVIAVPCALVADNGERIDPAIVWIGRRPPIETFTRRIRLYRGIAGVEPSRFALPMDVRRATVWAGEVAMGFAPTRVETTGGTPYVLHWATSLFNQGGCVGSEIRLSAKPFDRDEPISIAEGDAAYATYFIADWFEGAEALNKAREKPSLLSRLGALWRR